MAFTKMGVGAGLSNVSENLFRILADMKNDRRYKDEQARYEEDKQFKEKQYQDMLGRWLTEDQRNARADKLREAGVTFGMLQPGAQMPDNVKGTPYEAGFAPNPAFDGDMTPYKTKTSEDEMRDLQVKQIQQALDLGLITKQEAQMKLDTINAMDPVHRTQAITGVDTKALSGQDYIDALTKSQKEIARYTSELPQRTPNMNITPEQAVTAYVNSFKVPQDQDEKVWNAQMGPIRELLKDIIKKAYPTLNLDASPDPLGGIKPPGQGATTPTGPGLLERFMSGAKGIGSKVLETGPQPMPPNFNPTQPPGMRSIGPEAECGPFSKHPEIPCPPYGAGGRR